MLALLSHLRLRRSRPQCVVRAQLRWKRRQICGRKTQKAARRTGTRRACAGTAARGPPPRPVTPEHALPVRGAQTRGQARPCSVSRRHGNEKGEDSAGRPRSERGRAHRAVSVVALCRWWKPLPNLQASPWGAVHRKRRNVQRPLLSTVSG